MLAYLFAYGQVWLVIFGACFLVAAGFLYVLLRGLRTGVMPIYRGYPYVRERNPAAFRAAALVNAMTIVILVATPFYALWKYHP